MDFAKNLMKKYGWKEGEGLGKNRDGISKPLKANYKFDNAGLGLDKASDFNNHWWERVFNEAANNIQVDNTGESVQICSKNEDAVEITTNSFSIKKLKKQMGDSHKGFLKTSTLTGLGNEIDDINKINTKDLELKNYKPLTDEELFAACKGRTAHKGARHGLYLTGKLSRIEKQEREFLANLEKKSENCVNIDRIQVQKKKKRKHKESLELGNDLEQSVLDQTEFHKKSKKKKKEITKLDNELSSTLNNIGIQLKKIHKNDAKEIESSNIKQRKKRKKEIDGENAQEDIILCGDSVEDSIKPKKKKKKKNKFKINSDDRNTVTKDCFLKQTNFENAESNELNKKKLKKKMKLRTENLQEGLSVTCTA